ncbi:MAG: hypothetical protein DHS20C15_04370 [Planctomycetota bacterium]|nr:MAG: hypothetical protein DHS20C15_04370 [Planctomycetota bacterium]
MSVPTRPLLGALLAVLSLTAAAAADTVKVQAGESIQAVLESGELQAGDTLKLGKGKYVEVIRIPAELAGLTIQGQGAVLEALPNGGPSGAAITVDAADVTISGLTILHADDGENPNGGSTDGFALFVSADGFRGEKLKILRTNGVRIEGNDAKLDRVDVRATNGSGISVIADGATITRCRVEGATEANVSLIGNELVIEKLTASDAITGVFVVFSEDVVMRNLKLKRTVIGVQAESVTDLHVEKALIEHCELGILSRKNTLPVFEKLDVRSAREHGVLTIEDFFPTVRDCRIRDAGQHGIRVSQPMGQLLIADNRIKDVSLAGIHGGVDDAGFFAFRFNVIDGCATGIDFAAAAGPVLQENRITNARDLGLRITGVGSVLSGNLIRKGSGNGIRIDGQGALLDGNKVLKVLGEGIQNFAEACRLRNNTVIKTSGSPLTDAFDGNELIDEGGNTFGDGVVAGPGVPSAATDF